LPVSTEVRDDLYARYKYTWDIETKESGTGDEISLEHADAYELIEGLKADLALLSAEVSSDSVSWVIPQ
jgi:hypothetical protein